MDPVRGKTKKRMRPIRVLLCKPPLDMHSRGIIVVAQALRDAGMEVIYLEASPSIGPGEIVETAIQEDVDIIGLSILSGSPMVIVSRIISEKENKGIPEVPVIVGGIIPEEEIEGLKGIGVEAVFLPGTPLMDIVNCVNKLARSFDER
jgi:methylmalonyl-CoA mutase C-terminal domain/subunit